MLKYVDVMETFAEVPDEITLAINLSNCPHRCKGCHSAYLQEDIGTILTEEIIDILINQHKGITCIAFLGGDSDLLTLFDLLRYIKGKYSYIKTCWYTGFDNLRKEIFNELEYLLLNYLKIGSYKEEFGPLTNPNTNQRFYELKDNKWNDITYKFWK